MPPNQRYERLRERIAGRTGPYADLLLFTPDLFLLVARLLIDGRVPKRHKAFLAAALAYVVSPIDLLPRRLFGPLACLDDVIVLVVALNILLNETDPNVVLDNWSGNEDLLAGIRDLLKQADRAVGMERIQRILQYLGFRQPATTAQDA